jgi:hypothetical protein
MRYAALILLTCATFAPAAARAQEASDLQSALKTAYLDSAGVIRWRETGEEVALFGANYTLPSASDYRAAGYLQLDRKKLIEEDMAQFARMGWDALRLALWGDWENSDRAGNLVANDHLDLADWLIAKARERGIYILLSPIQTYNAGWPDAMSAPAPDGFSKYFDRGKLGTDPEAIAAQVNYLKQVLEHVNPYTGVALKDEPSIAFVDLINEPWHHPEDLEGSVRYINALTDAVRSTGCDRIVFYNVSQDFRITEAILQSKAEGVAFGWYPTGLNSGHELQGNYLRTVDAYDRMLAPAMARLPRIVYEFDSADLITGYMYPAMVRTFRAVGAQFAAMFAYDMLGTASRNLGWQTHYLNLVYTPRKAISTVIAAEAMRRLPRLKSYGAYPANTRFGDFRVSYEEDLGELAADDAFMYAGTTNTAPPNPQRLERIAGYGSSPVVSYEGDGVYFLDKVREGVWRLELYPDAVPVRDPFEMQSPDKVVTRAVYRTWPMQIRLPDLGASFTVQSVGSAKSAALTAQDGRFAVEPGVYVLSARGAVDPATLPARIGRISFAEYHAPKPDSIPGQVTVTAVPEYVQGGPMTIAARVVDTTPPDSVVLSIRPAGVRFFRRHLMRPAAGYEYNVAIPSDSLFDGPYEYTITAVRAGRAVTFPEAVPKRPWDWDYSDRVFWQTTLVEAATPLRLFRPAEDVARLAFTRIGDAIRRGLFRVVPSSASGEPAFHLELPVMNNWSPDDYTASLVIKDRIQARAAAIDQAKAVKLRLRGVGPRQALHVTLVERDGTSWSTSVAADSTWQEHVVPLSDFKPARAVMLPQGFPGEWSYWMAPAEGRGGAGDAPRLREIERLQFSLRKEGGAQPKQGGYGVEIESVTLMFESSTSKADRP